MLSRANLGSPFAVRDYVGVGGNFAASCQSLFFFALQIRNSAVLPTLLFFSIVLTLFLGRGEVSFILLVCERETAFHCVDLNVRMEV